MSIWTYSDSSDPKLLNQTFNSGKCIYCGALMESLDLEDMWLFEVEKVIDDLKKGLLKYINIFNLEDYGYEDFSYRRWENFPILSSICNYCGWWSVEKPITICSGDWKNWDLYYGAVGVLKNLALDNLSNPVKEVRDYLTARYEKKMFLHPRLFEQVVSSVFKSIGYNTILTKYRNDGGIDIFLNKNSIDFIGVQVKRWKNSIRINEIRAFLGALVHDGLSKGIFVSTSSFQSGCENFSNRHSIELIDGTKFYDILKEAQKNDFFVNERSLISKNNDLHLYFIDPRNSFFPDDDD